MALIRLIDPDGNPVLTMSEAGAEELRSRGYSDPEPAGEDSDSEDSGEDSEDSDADADEHEEK